MSKNQNSPSGETGNKSKRPSGKGSLSSIAFDKELKDSENPYILAENETKKKKRLINVLIDTAVIIACMVLSLALNIRSFHVPFTPSIISVDFSAFPILFVALTINPFISIVVMLAKTLIYYLVNPLSAPNIPAKIIIDFVFILVTYLIFRMLNNSAFVEKRNDKREFKNKAGKDYSVTVMILAGLGGSMAAALCSILTVKYLVLPVLYSDFSGFGYNEASVLNSYKAAFEGLISYLPFIKKIMPLIKSINGGIMFYNIPLNFAKYFACSVFSTLISAIYNDYMQSRKAE